MTFISLSKAKKIYLMKYTFFASLDEINVIFMTKKMNFLFIIYNFEMFKPESY